MGRANVSSRVAHECDRASPRVRNENRKDSGIHPLAYRLVNDIRRTHAASAPSPPIPPVHPNDVDRRRILRLLKNRRRYRYTQPVVLPGPDGYIVRSPCCSRRIDGAGGVIDIAWLRYRSGHNIWHLYRRDHATEAWVIQSTQASLTEAIAELNNDPMRVFWA